MLFMDVGPVCCAYWCQSPNTCTYIVKRRGFAPVLLARFAAGCNTLPEETITRCYLIGSFNLAYLMIKTVDPFYLIMCVGIHNGFPLLCHLICLQDDCWQGSVSFALLLVMKYKLWYGSFAVGRNCLLPGFMESSSKFIELLKFKQAV